MSKNSIKISAPARVWMVTAVLLFIAIIVAGIFYYRTPEIENPDEPTDEPVSLQELLTTFQGLVPEPEVGKKVVVRLTISSVDTAAHVIDFSYTVHGKGNQQKNKTGRIVVGDKKINFSTIGDCIFYKTRGGRVVLESVNKDWKLTEIQ